MAPFRWIRDRMRRTSSVRGIRVTAALAALLLATGLVVRLSVSLTSRSPAARGELAPASGELALVDDAGGVPLFPDTVLAPDDDAEACIGLSIHAAEDPDPVRLRLGGDAAASDLAPFVALVIDRGVVPDTTAGCAGFEAQERVATGALPDLLAAHGDDGAGLPSWDPPAGEQQVWYRFRARLAGPITDDLQASTVSGLSFHWVATSGGGGARPLWLDRSVVLAAAVAQHSILPLLIMLVIAILFIGIQDRIDRHDPKLALAPVASEPITFEPVP